MRTAHVQIVHDSPSVSYAEARRVVRALRAQAQRHFAPAYGLRAEVDLVARGKEDRDAWQIVIADDLAHCQDEGWHEVTAAGLPLGRVLALQCASDAGGWSSAASHELLEMLADPDMSLAVLVQNEGAARLYAYEVCDPVQDNRCGYDIEGVRVSNFVLPPWFEPFRGRGQGPYDQAGTCTRPLEVKAGGYALVCHADWVHGWRDLGPSRGKAGTSRGSRRGRRCLPKNEWKRSRVHVNPG